MITPKNLYRLQAWMFLAAAIVVPAILASSADDLRSKNGAWILLAIFGGLSAYYWFRSFKTPADVEFYDIRKRPPREQIRVSWILIAAMLLLVPLLTFWTYRDLSSLENGTASSVSVWAPIAMVYDYCGFMPAVLCWPLLGLYAVGASLVRIVTSTAIISREEQQST